MAEAICDTSALQYLHQLGRLEILHRLVGHIIVPSAVVDELAAGRALGLSLPDPETIDWIEVRPPISASALPLVTDLGAGEAEVLALALDYPGIPVILDDGLARRTAQRLGLPLTGTLGLLLDAKSAGLVPSIAPLLDQLEVFGFHLDANTRAYALSLAARPSSLPVGVDFSVAALDLGRSVSPKPGWRNR